MNMKTMTGSAAAALHSLCVRSTVTHLNLSKTAATYMCCHSNNMFVSSHAVTCVHDFADRRDLPGHLKECLEPRMDIAQRVPGCLGPYERSSSGQPPELRCRCADVCFFCHCDVMTCSTTGLAWNLLCHLRWSACVGGHTTCGQQCDQLSSARRLVPSEVQHKNVDYNL
eukprot:GHRQ01038673.1.p1 GENE.GHRQ01038673.1~~GHRQ01038673.1.p1  ORF type:complete len:169 (+),score=12.61 GHRQ01038673.1:564-1070(+)